MKSKKGQMSLQDAPSIVLIVGLIFLIMATIAFIGSKYGTAIGSDVSYTVSNETVAVTTAGTAVANADACNFDSFAVTIVTNSTGDILNSANYTAASTGTVANTSSTVIYGGNSWKVSYTYTDGGVACGVTSDLQTEIGNNTSIAGIVLTISLVGIVLAVLMGIFVVTRTRGRA